MPRSVALETRVEAFRSLVLRGVAQAIEAGLPIKPYEGKLQLHWPAYFRLRSYGAPYSLHLSCSIGPGETNHYAWKGHNWAEVFRKATRDVEHWIAEIGAAPADQPREGEDPVKRSNAGSGAKHSRKAATRAA